MAIRIAAHMDPKVGQNKEPQVRRMDRKVGGGTSFEAGSSFIAGVHRTVEAG